MWCSFLQHLLQSLDGGLRKHDVPRIENLIWRKLQVRNQPNVAEVPAASKDSDFPDGQRPGPFGRSQSFVSARANVLVLWVSSVNASTTFNWLSRNFMASADLSAARTFFAAGGSCSHEAAGRKRSRPYATADYGPRRRGRDRCPSVATASVRCRQLPRAFSSCGFRHADWRGTVSRRHEANPH